MKVAKKEFACNGTVVEHPEYGEVRKLSLHFHVKFFVSLVLVSLIIFTLTVIINSGCSASGRPEGENLSNAGENFLH